MALFTLVNGGLYYLFSEFCMLRGQDRTEFKECAAICRSNFEYTLGKFDLLTAPTLENIQALCLGVSLLSRLRISKALFEVADTHRPFILSIFLDHRYAGPSHPMRQDYARYWGITDPFQHRETVKETLN